MNIDVVIIYFTIVIFSVGTGLALFFRLSHSLADMEAQITGSWTNESNTLRILIYSMESKFRAEVIWTRNSEVNLLGSDVIRNMDLRYFGRGEGTYIDPFTKHQFKLTLKVKNTGQLLFHLIERSGQGAKKVEAWRAGH